MFKIGVIAVAVGMIIGSVAAEVSVSGSVAVQVAKKAEMYSEGRLDDAWMRAELKVSGKLESGVHGLVHFRAEPKIKDDKTKTPLQPRQIYFALPVSTVEILAGRWYEVYANGNTYFGRYVFDANDIGTGNMNTNYSVLDGIKMGINLDAIKSKVQIGVLPGDPMFETANLLASFGGSPVEGLDFSLIGNFGVLMPEGKEDDAVHRTALNCGYTLVKDLNFKVFGEAAIVNFEEASDNAWFMAGLTSSVPGVLDRIQAEFEIKNFRNGATDSESNLCWMVLLQKKLMGITFDLNVGADQKSLGSKTPGEVGVIFRTSTKF